MLTPWSVVEAAAWGVVVVVGGGMKEQTGYCIAPVFPPIRDPPNTNRALGLAFLNTLWRGQELRIDRFLMALHFFFFPLLVLSGLCNVCEWIKVSCAAQRCGFVLLLVAQLPLWGGTSPGEQMNAESYFFNLQLQKIFYSAWYLVAGTFVYCILSVFFFFPQHKHFILLWLQHCVIFYYFQVQNHDEPTIFTIYKTI